MRETRQQGDRHAAPSAAAERSDVEHLVREFQAGKSPETSFGRLFERFCAPVTHFFTNRGFSTAEAEDLAQECFLRVYRNMGRFRFESSFETWLFQVVANVWKNALRSRSTHKRSVESVRLDEILDRDDGERRNAEPGDPAAGPLEQALEGERARLLRQAIDELPPKMRRCMLLRLGQDLKYREIAAALQVSMATVRSQLSAGYERLKPLLEKHFAPFEIES